MGKNLSFRTLKCAVPTASTFNLVYVGEGVEKCFYIAVQFTFEVVQNCVLQPSVDMGILGSNLNANFSVC
jgi:hypothetical protein